tara:strand:+ start:12207 stop:13523 length:1317 start_codon:yes stop_codon:yes gene_type:complete
MNVRVAATHVITAILQDEGSLSSLLPHYATKVEDRDRGLMQQLCYGTLRYYPRLSAYLNLLLAKPFKDKDKDLEAVLACSLYQLLETRIPPHAAVNEAVATCKALKKPWAKGLVNAVLRRFLRERIELDSALEKDQAFKTAHPNWLVELWREAWPDQLDAIIEANNAHPPMTLRVNQSRSNQTQYLKQLEIAGFESSATAFSPEGISLEKPQDVLTLPGFSEGNVSVQDEAAQLAAHLLELKPGQRILDACCAPGGKTCHILELLRSTGEQSSDVVALDISAKRLERVEENLERLSLQATLISADAADTNTWWDGQHFDRILLDAPCSATGVIRRHPDVKLLRKPADIAKLASLQLTLLNALWPLLKEDGILLYATCSTLPQENDEVVLNFVRTASNATVEKLHLEAGLETPAGRQLLPLIGGHDGFYYAQLRKTSLH